MSAHVARPNYGERIPVASRGGVVSAVEPGSPAARAYIEVDDVILAAQGERVRDIIDWQWLADDDAVSLQVVKPGNIMEEFVLSREPGEPWGLSFTETVFDGVRTCRNSCTFCFMTQLPKGLRRALYLRDDDFRLSFLQGNFITLTNLTPEDVARIAEQHLSPLYVSIHAIDPDVRAELVCAKQDRALKRFDQLLDAGIDLHTQIVLVPGVNDGAVLDETLTWLAEREGVLSVGIVPLGYTRHQQRFSESFESPEASRAVIAQVAAWQEASRERDGVTWVHLADEFYLNAKAEVPAEAAYDDYPQYENGIGMVRSFTDEIAESREELAAALGAVKTAGSAVAFVSGTLFAPVLQHALNDLGADPSVVSVLAVENRFFGGNVSVTGLLTAADLLPAITAVPEASVVFVPDVVLNSDGLLLDDVPGAELGMRTGRDVRLLSCDAGGILAGLRGAVPTRP